MKNVTRKLQIITGVLAIKSVTLATSSGGAGLVWESPIEQIVNSVSGPVAFGVGILAIIVAVFSWMMADGPVLGRALKILCGLAIIFGATAFITGIYKVSSGTLF